MKMWSGRGGQIGGARWPNWGKGDRGLLWPSVWKNFFRSGQILQFTHDLFQFYKAFATKNFVVWENDSQSWNPCFLGVRSPNQLPKASWLGNLTTKYPTSNTKYMIMNIKHTTPNATQARCPRGLRGQLSVTEKGEDSSSMRSITESIKNIYFRITLY